MEWIQALDDGFWYLNVMVTDPFYFYHFLAFFSYLIIRTSISHTLLHREIQAILAFLALTLVKLVKEETWEAFISDILFYAKAFLIVAALIMDYHLAIYYMVGFLAIFLLSQQPPYDGLGNSSHLTPLQLETVLTEGNTSRFWLVEFRATCSSSSIRTSRFLPDLSVIYSNKNISFGILDLGHFPNVAETFGISMGVGLGRLPTYILFDNAVEVARLPELNAGANLLPFKLTKVAIWLQDNRGLDSKENSYCMIDSLGLLLCNDNRQYVNTGILG